MDEHELKLKYMGDMYYEDYVVKCKELQRLPPPPMFHQDEISNRSSRFSWKVVVMRGHMDADLCLEWLWDILCS
ncbi:hypothetical protein ACSBR2_012611 [Camellia fascicularis]